MPARPQMPHRGLRASHTWRPCSIRRSESIPHSSGGTMAPRSASIFTGSSSAVSRSRCESRVTCVSTGRPGQAVPDRPHHVAGLAPDSGQRHEIGELGRDLAAEPRLHRLRHPDQVLRLRSEEAGRANQLLDLFGVGGGEIRRRRIPREQRGRHHVDPLVGALRRQDRRREQLIRAVVRGSARSAHRGRARPTAPRPHSRAPSHLEDGPRPKGTLGP